MVIHRFGRLFGAKEKFKENVWYSIWYPLFDDGIGDDVKSCFDIDADDIDDAIALLEHLKTSVANDYTEDDNGKSKV